MIQTPTVLLRAISALAPYTFLARIRVGVLAQNLLAQVSATASEALALLLLVPVIALASQSGPGHDGGTVGKLVHFTTELGLNPSLAVFLGLFFLASIVSVSLRYVASTMNANIGVHVERQLRETLFDAVIQMDWPFFSQTKSTGVVTALYQGSYNASIGFQQLILGISSIFASAIYLCLAFLISWQATLITALFVVGGLPAFWYLTRRGRQLTQNYSLAAHALSSDFLQYIGNAKSIFGQGLRRFVIRKTTERCAEYADYRAQIETNRHRVILLFELSAVIFIVLLFGTLLVRGSTELSIVAVVVAIFYRLAPRILTLQQSIHQAVVYAPWLTDWRSYYDLAKAHSAVPEQLLDGKEAGLKCLIELRDVSYTYPGADRPAVSSVNLVIRAGEAVFFIGQSGHGKSTLVDLIIGICRPDEGEIYVDGVALADIDLERWQANLGLVQQENPMFHASIEQNIRFGAGRTRDKSRVEAAAKAAHALEFVSSMPRGFDTVLGDRGVTISGGQRQRLALARALYRDPRLLVLDEPSSALDEASTLEIVRSLARCKGSVTLVVATHDARLMTLADRVFKVENGRVVEIQADEVPEGAVVTQRT